MKFVSGRNADRPDLAKALHPSRVTGATLLIADDHQGLRAAARRVFNDEPCRAICPSERNNGEQSKVPHTPDDKRTGPRPARQRKAVAGMLKTIFAQNDLSSRSGPGFTGILRPGFGTERRRRDRKRLGRCRVAVERNSNGLRSPSATMRAFGAGRADAVPAAEPVYLPTARHGARTGGAFTPRRAPSVRR